MTRRHWHCIAAAALSLLPTWGMAQSTFPSRPVRFIITFTPGALNDLIGRTLSPKLGEIWGQQVVVDNRPGGGTIIGTELAARAPADGHTMLLGGFALVVNPFVYPKLPYDTMKDLAPVSMIASSPYVLVISPTLPAKSVKEFVAVAKARPGQLAYGTTGIGGTSHLMGEMLKSMAGIDVIHVPYKGLAPALTDLFANQVHFSFGSWSTVGQHVKTGRLRAIAVTSSKRAQSTPELPTIAEEGYPGYEAIPWFGILLPAGAPKPLVNRMRSDIVKALASSEVRDRFAAQGVETAGTTPEEFATFMKLELNRWGKIVKQAGVKPE